MCDVNGCVRFVDARREGRTPDGRAVALGLCVGHRQAFDSAEELATGAGTVRRPCRPLVDST